MIYCLDTHTIYWLLGSYRKLGSRARSILAREGETFIVPSIVLVELLRLMRRSGDAVSPETLLIEIAQCIDFMTYSFDLPEFRRMSPLLEQHDAMIVACALSAAESSSDEVALITCDEEITKSGLVRTVW